MNDTDWLTGEVILPRSEVAVLRREFRKMHDELIEEAYVFLKRFRHQNPTPSRLRWNYLVDSALAAPENKTPPRQLALRVAKDMGSPRASKRSDFVGNYHGKAKVTTDVFPVYDNSGELVGEIQFSARKLTWTAPEGVNAVARFRNAQQGKHIYFVVNSIDWHRGTGGGETVYNNRFEEAVISDTYGSRGNRYRSAYTWATLIGP